MYHVQSWSQLTVHQSDQKLSTRIVPLNPSVDMLGDCTDNDNQSDNNLL